MATDRQLATILNSGEITSMYIGDTTSADNVQVASDVALSILSAGTTSELSEQTLVAETPEVLNWFEDVVIELGSDISYTAVDDEINIITTGIYKLGGAFLLDAPNGDDVDICLYINGSPTSNCGHTIGRGAGKHVVIVYYTAVALSAADDLTLWVESDGTSITIQSANLVIEKIG